MRIEPGTWCMVSNKLNTEPCSQVELKPSILDNRWLMAKKIIEYVGEDDGSQYNWLLDNQLCNTIDNHNRKSLPNRF